VGSCPPQTEVLAANLVGLSVVTHQPSSRILRQKTLRQPQQPLHRLASELEVKGALKFRSPASPQLAY